MDVVRGPDSENLISQWIRDYEKDLLRLCFVYLKDAALAEDAVQETCLASPNENTPEGAAAVN